MSKRATAVLAVVVLALLAYILKFERSSLTSGELDKREGKVLTAFVRDKVERLEIQRKGRRAVLERKPNPEGGFQSWRMTEPFQAEADESAVDHVLGELEWLDARRTLIDITETDRKRFGLDKPRYRVSFRASGRIQRLSLGQNDVRGEGVYAQVDDVPSAFVVPKTLLEALDHEPGHYRAKNFLGDIVTAWGRKLVIQQEAGRVELEKKEGRWWLMGSSPTYADSKTVDKLLRGLDDLRAVRFLEGDDASAAQASLVKPVQTLELRIVPDEGREDKKPERVELRLGGACAGHEGERLAAKGAGGAPVCVREEDVKAISVESSAWAQAEPIGAEPSEVESFELAVGATKLSLKREGEAWKLSPGTAGSVDREAVEHWLEDLVAERALAFPKLAPLEEKARLTVHLAAGKTQSIVLGQPGPDGSVLGRRDQEPTLVRYRAALFDQLVPSPLRFASLQLWSHQPSEVRAFEAKSAPLGRKLMLRDQRWRTAPDAPEVPDAPRVRELLRELVRLRALAFVADRPRAEHALQGAAMSLDLELGSTDAGQAQKRRLELGGPTLRGAYARVDGGAVYEVPREVLSLVRELAGGPRAEASAGSGPEEHPEDGDDEEHDHP